MPCNFTIYGPTAACSNKKKRGRILKRFEESLAVEDVTRSGSSLTGPGAGHLYWLLASPGCYRRPLLLAFPILQVARPCSRHSSIWLAKYIKVFDLAEKRRPTSCLVPCDAERPKVSSSTSPIHHWLDALQDQCINIISSSSLRRVPLFCSRRQPAPTRMRFAWLPMAFDANGHGWLVNSISSASMGALSPPWWRPVYDLIHFQCRL